MRAILVRRFGQPASVESIDEPACPSDGVVVQVEATGVCRSDWHAWSGHDPAVTVPFVPGHELVGTVVQAGPYVRRWSPGSRVTVPFACACGTCAACASGQHQVCPYQRQPGFTDDGSFAELVALHHADTNLVALPPELASTSAAALGCRVATAFRALHTHGRVRPYEEVVVIGAGGVGLAAVMIAQAAGAHVVVVDPSAAAREVAAALGADVLEPAGSPEDTAAAATVATSGGAHVSLDALGSPQTAATSVLSLRRRGRHVQAGLLLAENSWTSLPMARVISWELELYGTHGMSTRDYPALLAAVSQGKFDPSRLVTRTVPLDGAPDALVAVGTDLHDPGITVVIP
ncbi:MAG: alcohol dehydrogenase catalytic domain-containing protein [Micrococcales bacterium]|nr:alcohol dehydrogenase catalytic domain-containing protein [Micrococcales bacterium]MCL2667976.1 alcohol dehydrogenase catalytic domain-containing protein [Micrococcales bacterium]